MASGVIVNLSQLAVRSLLSQRVGLAELGLYQAASGIAVTYLAFILQAMSADFYPRISALPAGSPEAEKLVNEQTEVALLLAGPVIFSMLGAAEWVLGLLYTGEFAAGAMLLRWMVLGDVLRIASWPLGFALLASGRGRIFVVLELIAFGTFVGATYLLVPMFGVQAAGIGFFAMYLLYLPLVFLAVRSRSAFRWSRSVWRDLALLLAGSLAILVLATWNSFAAALIGLAMAGLWFASGVRRLRHLLPETWAKRLGWR
jgi:PST family polysaccharide transporter